MLLACRPISCLLEAPRSRSAAWYDFRPSVTIEAGQAWRFSAFFMKVSAAFLSRVLVT